MNTVVIFLIVLISYVLLWLVANLVLYYLSIVLKKPVILESFHAISTLFLWFYNAILGGVLLWIGIDLLISRQFLWLIIYLFIGSSIIGWFFQILELPFLFIQSYFANKLANFDFDENIVEAEILDEKHKVIGKTEGDSAISRRVAKYFILSYSINLLDLFIFPDKNKSYMWGDYLLTPFLQVFGGTFIVGVPYAIYHKIRYKTFIQSDKRYFFIIVWKIWVIVVVILVILVLVLSLINNLY